MRVVAGKFKSRSLGALRGVKLRPTSDRLRETLFDILGPAVDDSVFLDLYAGTGVVVDPKHPPKVGDSLEETERILRGKPFSEYFSRVFAPYYLKHRPNSTSKSLIADNRLAIIGDALRSNTDYYVQTNSDDLILDKPELAWLRDTLGSRIAVYDHGGHLGNLGDRSQISDMLDMVGGHWDGTAR